MPKKDDRKHTVAPKRCFQQQPPSAKTLQDMYEHNVMGATAGFFCAVWAGRLLGEHFSSTLTTLGYEDAEAPCHYYFGIRDVAVGVLVASKILFVRTCIIRFIIRPLLSNRLANWVFSRRVRLETVVCSALVQLASVCMGVWAALPILTVQTQWHGIHEPPESVPLGTKAFVIVQGAMQVAYIVVQLVEDPEPTGVLHTKLTALLTLCIIAAASAQGVAPIAGLAVAAASLPRLAAELSQSGQILGKNWKWSSELCKAASALLLAALCACPLALLYISVQGAVHPTDQDRFPASASLLVGGLAAVQALVSLRSAGRVLQRGLGPSAHE